MAKTFNMESNYYDERFPVKSLSYKRSENDSDYVNQPYASANASGYAETRNNGSSQLQSTSSYGNPGFEYTNDDEMITNDDDMTPSQDIERQSLSEPPKDYLPYAIFAMVVCCFPIGFTAVQSSLECRRAIAYKNKAIAEEKSEEAKTRANLTLLIGICTWIVIVCFIIVGVLSQGEP